MKYKLGSEWFPSKKAVTERGSGILKSGAVSERDHDFLMALFQNHSEWSEKEGNGVASIRVGNDSTINPGGWKLNKCFWLTRRDGTEIWISLHHCIRELGGRGKGAMLATYKTAARSAISEQVLEFKSSVFGAAEVIVCPDTGQQSDWDSAVVDHVYPDTFDRLLCEFTKRAGVRDLHDIEISDYKFGNVEFEQRWREYHDRKAKLEVVSRKANWRRGRASVSWSFLNVG